MIIPFLIAITMAQILGYILGKKYKKKFALSTILIFILIGHIFIFPKFFYPSYLPNQMNCGMPILGVHLSFVFFGIPLTLLTHIIYYPAYIKRLKP